MRARILVSGAAGKTGSVVVADLLKAYYPVRAMVHREGRRPA
jgi:NAD(P)H dehydrogenase (quinone)